MAFSGADVAQLRALASRFEVQANKLNEIATSSSTAIMVADWTGANIDRVRSEWNRASKPRVVALARECAEMATILKRNADEQERASGGAWSSPPMVPGLPWPLPSLPPWGRTTPRFDPWSIGVIDDIREKALEPGLDLLRTVADGSDLVEVIKSGETLKNLVGKRIPVVSGILAGYDLIRDGGDTWEDIQSGNIWRFGKAVFRTGYTIAKINPAVGIIDAAAGLGFKAGTVMIDSLMGAGTVESAVQNVGRQIDEVGNSINAAGERAGKAVADGIKNAANAIISLFGGGR